MFSDTTIAIDNAKRNWKMEVFYSISKSNSADQGKWLSSVYVYLPTHKDCSGLEVSCAIYLYMYALGGGGGLLNEKLSKANEIVADLSNPSITPWMMTPPPRNLGGRRKENEGNLILKQKEKLRRKIVNERASSTWQVVDHVPYCSLRRRVGGGNNPGGEGGNQLSQPP